MKSARKVNNAIKTRNRLNFIFSMSSNNNTNLTQFSKDSLNWNKITKDSSMRATQKWEYLNKNKNLEKVLLNGKSVELIKPDTCDVYGPQNSQRVIRRKLISKEVENIEPKMVDKTKEKTNYKNSQDYKQSQEILNYVAYENIPADRSYQTLIFDTESTKQHNFNLESELDLFTKYLEAVKIFGAYGYQKLIAFKNNQTFLLKTQRINIFSLKNQLGLNFTRFIAFYYLLHYKQNLIFTNGNTFILSAFTFLSLVCNYLNLTYLNKTDVSYSNKEILKVINTSSLSFLIKKYILGQSIFMNCTMQIYLLKTFLFNINYKSISTRGTVYFGFLALLVINFIASLDELLFDLVPIFVTITDTESNNTRYDVNSSDDIFKAKSSFNEETASMNSEVF